MNLQELAQNHLLLVDQLRRQIAYSPSAMERLMPTQHGPAAIQSPIGITTMPPSSSETNAGLRRTCRPRVTGMAMRSRIVPIPASGGIRRKVHEAAMEIHTPTQVLNAVKDWGLQGIVLHQQPMSSRYLVICTIGTPL